MRRLHWHFNAGDVVLYLLAVIVVVVSIAQSIASGQEEFSIHKAKVVTQEPPKDAEEMEFSISKQETIQDDLDMIEFSVHNAKPIPKPDVGDAQPCTEQRISNRVLVFVDGRKHSEQRNVQICERGKPCRWVLQTVEVGHDSSQAILKELVKLSNDGQDWKVDIKGGDECVHFKVIDVTKSENVDMVKELRIESKDLPLVVKENEDSRRKKANGMKAKDLAEWYLKQLVQPIPEGKPPVAKCVPGGFAGGSSWYNPSHNCPKCGRLQYDIYNENGPVANSHVHKCSYCKTSWYHADAGRVIQKPSTRTFSKQVAPQASRTSLRNVSFGYPQGSFQGGVANYALSVAQQTARAPPIRASFSSDPKKAVKEEKKWKEKERKRIRQEVRRKVWSRYATFDPFTWLTIIQILIQVFQFIFNHYGLN